MRFSNQTEKTLIELTRTQNQRCNWNEEDDFGITVTIDSNHKKKEEESDKTSI